MREKLAAWVVLAALLGGCESDCDLVRGCPKVDSDAGPDDFSARIGSGTIVSLSANGHEWPWLLRGGEAVFTAEPRDCDFLTTECRVTVKRLELRFGNVTLELTGGRKLVANDVVLRLEAPVEATSNDNINFATPTGSTFQTCATIDGERAHGEAPSGAVGLYIVRYPSEGFAVEQYDSEPMEIVLHAGGDECQDIRVKVNGLNAAGSFERVPEP